jgi:hypothetical protein
MRARQRARGRTFHELLEATDATPELLAYVLRDERRRGRIEYHSTSRRYAFNGGIPEDVKAALRGRRRSSASSSSRPPPAILPLIGPNFEVPGNAAARIRDVASDGVDVIVEVAAGASAELDQAVLRPRGTISIYANDGGAPFNLDVRRNMGLNSRYQFVLLYTVGWELITAAAADINQAIEDGAFRVGEEAGLPLHRFNLEDAPAAHAAVERAADELPGLRHRFEEDLGVAVEGIPLGLRQRFPGSGVVVNWRDVLHASLLSIVWLLSELGRSGRRGLDIARKIIRMCRERARGSDSSTDPPDRGGRSR